MNSVNDFIAKLENQTRRADSTQLVSVLEEESGYKARLKGSIISFGQYHYQYESGLEGDSSVIAFSPRKANLVVYIMPGFSEYKTLLKSLGKHKLGKSCLYINKLKDINIEVLRKIAKDSVAVMQKRYQCKAQ